MKMTALQTVKVKGKYVAPNEEFEIDNDDAKRLIAAGAAEQKTRKIIDDGEGSGDPTTDTSLPASGATDAPDPNAVGAAAKTAKRP